MAKSTEESAAECSLHCKIEDNDEYSLEGKLAGQGLDLAYFSVLLLLPKTLPAACFLGMLFQRLCRKSLPKGEFYFSNIPNLNTNFVNHFFKPASRNLAEFSDM